MLKPLIELLVADAFWGFGFIAAVWALRDLGTPAIIFYRFGIAFFIGIIILFFSKVKRSEMVYEFKISLPAGLLLAATLALQTWGLKTVPAAESAFITT